MPGTVAEGPTVALSFANNFWGKDDAGLSPMLDRMHTAKLTCDELKTFYNSRANIEDEYARKMIALCRKPLGSSETGTLRASLDVMRGEVESMGKSHQGIASQMRSELEEPLGAFSGSMKERRKIVQNGVEKLYKTKQQQAQAVNKSRDRYEQDCLKIKGYLAQGHMVMGQEERKNKAKMEKTQIQLAATSNDYEAALKALEETTIRWNREWKSACDKFQDLEEERLDFTKSSLWTFANIASTVCVSDDTSCENIRLSLENCEVEKDICLFIQERGTGQEILDPPKFINFCRGDLNETASETSEDEHYSVAQFQRTINPAFRSSSPQPSTFESHNDPQSNLARQMGHISANRPPSREATSKPHEKLDKQLSMVDHLMQTQGDSICQVPHNEYPTDGMTMLCRTTPASDRSSAMSPARPSSRDTQSEYSNPTSFSSQEPKSEHPSPKKQTFDHIASSASSSKQVQKKSGFFSNSPFRRKSKHEKEVPGVSSDVSRKAWNPYDSTIDNNIQKAGRNNREDRCSVSPEPVDPRADFQLNVGPNVFDVHSLDSNLNKRTPRKLGSPNKELDPMAAALEELRDVNKQSSSRVSADRYAGVATPAPPSTSNTHGSEVRAALRGTPPPSYSDQSPRRLNAPQPAFTSAQMQSTTRKYVGQTQEIYGSPRSDMRRATSEVPRATSPRPLRSSSPRQSCQGKEQSDVSRVPSPSPYNNGRHLVQSPNSQPSKQGSSGQGSLKIGGGTPSPRSKFPRQEQRNSSGMAMQLADGESSRLQHGSGARPTSYYGRQQSVEEHGGRNRSKSLVDGQNFTKDRRPILHYARAMYMYRAAIPEELSFAKGDIMTVLRLQDDGWWEAEICGKNERPGLVPSNYLQAC